MSDAILTVTGRIVGSDPWGPPEVADANPDNQSKNSGTSAINLGHGPQGFLLLALVAGGLYLAYKVLKQRRDSNGTATNGG